MPTYTITSPYARHAARFIMAMLLDTDYQYQRQHLSRTFILILKGQTQNQ